MLSLDTKIATLGGVYKRYSNALARLEIISLQDLLLHVPFRYDDFHLISDIDNAQEGETVTIRGEVKDIGNTYLRSYKTLQKATIKDATGEIEAVWFNQPYLTKSIPKGARISLSGKISENRGEKVMQSPQYEIADGEFIHTGRLVPVYPETRGVSSKWLRKEIWKILSREKLNDFLPEQIRKENNLPKLYDALNAVHFPNSLDNAQESRLRLAFDELFITHLASLKRKEEWGKKYKGFSMKIDENKLKDLTKTFPFELTNAQKRSMNEILEDLSGDKPMNRLLEGDVGSGKTVVASIATYVAHLNGYKSLLMAPTEILATQHYKTLKQFLSPFSISVGLQTSTQRIKGDDIVVGTQALLHGKEKIENLGLVIIDEQQRFGVEQRSILREKGHSPHVLTMTATPIPRTVALTIYGDLDLSVLDEMPEGRKIVKTWLVPNAKRTSAYVWIEKEIKTNKSQAFIICPFIEESESLATVKAASKEFERLKKEVFPKLKLGLLHGKMKGKEKDKVLDEFQKGELDILVATPVVEVGIDIPGASIVVIEAAERFGLAQLHQLRGRVGRRGQDAYCLLFSETKSSTERLRYMEKTNIGSELAEYDLKIRGAGEIYGTAQHGTRYFKIADLSNLGLVKKTKEEAQKLVGTLDEYKELKKKVFEVNTKQVSPD